MSESRQLIIFLMVMLTMMLSAWDLSEIIGLRIELQNIAKEQP